MIVWFAWHVGISVTVLKRPHTEQDSSPFTFLSRTQTQWMTCISHNHTVLLRVCSCGYCYVRRNRGNMVCLSFHLFRMHKVYFLVTTMISRCPAEVSKFQSCWIIAQPWMTSCLICFPTLRTSWRTPALHQHFVTLEWMCRSSILLEGALWSRSYDSHNRTAVYWEMAVYRWPPDMCWG